VEQSPETGSDIWTLPLEDADPGSLKPGKPEPFLRMPFVEVQPAFSPDGHWLAYASNESRPMEIYVRPFLGPEGKWQVSNGGGTFPTWSRAGHALFYRTLDNRIMAASYTTEGDSFAVDKPRLWSEKRFADLFNIRNFDVAPDGKRAAVLMATEGTGEKATPHLTFMLNFFDELHRRAPVR
jgi:eukaryotic-like serine/threonine-protein kinase